MLNIKPSEKIKALALGCFSILLTAVPSVAAERVSFSSPLGEFTISVDSLEKYARSGKIDSELAYYAGFLKKQQMVQLRSLLQKKVDISSVKVAQLLYSSMGETLLEYFGEYVRTDRRQNGFYALRSALILSASEPEGLTLINILNNFPSNTIRINSRATFELIGSLTELLDKTDKASALIAEKSKTEATEETPKNLQQIPDLTKTGNFKWEKQTIALNDGKRNRNFSADLYLPESSTPVPLIVISHGVGSDRTDFIYLGSHLASHGFAVAIPDHPGSNTEQLKNLLRGAAREAVEPNEYLDRPRDVSFVLDQLQRLNQTILLKRLDMQKIGVMGHSYGGYTALAIAGAKLNFQEIQQECRVDNINLNIANVSHLLQCLALELPQQDYELNDKRVKAVLAINPVTSSVFGQTGLSKIQIPTMLISSSNDAVTPALLEQICPFTWLNQPDKYLGLVQNGTHSDANQNADVSDLSITTQFSSPNPKQARSYYQAFALAFAKTYIQGDETYRQYLTAGYAEAISFEPLPLKLVRSLQATELSSKVKLSCPIPNPKSKIQNLKSKI